MRPITRSLFATILCLFIAAGCSSSDDDDDAPESDTSGTEDMDLSGMNPDETGDTSMPAPGTTPGAPVLTTFDGEWFRSYNVSDLEFPDEGCDVITLTIAGDVATVRILDYTDSTCQTPGIPAEVVLSASIAYPGGTTETAQGVATNIDVMNESAIVDGVAQPLDAESGATEYDIAFIDENELYFGDFDSDPDRDGESPERRPTVLESIPFLRQ